FSVIPLISLPLLSCFFFFAHPATPAIYTLSLHDALPISECPPPVPLYSLLISSINCPRFTPTLTASRFALALILTLSPLVVPTKDRKSTRLNSSHVKISYAVFCLKKKKKIQHPSNSNNTK